MSCIYRFRNGKKNPLNQKGLSTFLQVVGQQSFLVETIKKKHLIQLFSEVLIIMGTISSLFGSSKPLNHSHIVKWVKANNWVTHWIKTFNSIVFILTKEHWYIKFIFSIYFPFDHHYVHSIQHCSYKRPKGACKDEKHWFKSCQVLLGSALQNTHLL